MCFKRRQLKPVRLAEVADFLKFWHLDYGSAALIAHQFIHLRGISYFEGRAAANSERPGHRSFACRGLSSEERVS